MPEDTFTASATAASNQAEVWKALQQADTWAGLGLIDEVSDPIVADGALQSFRWAAMVAGRRYQGTATVTHSAPHASMVVELSTSEVAGSLQLELSPNESGTRIDVTLTARSKGWLAGAFWGTISSALGGGLQDSVSRFAADL